MSTGTIESDLRRNLKVRMRPDLVVTEQKFGGRTFFVVKDPVSLRYYRFRPEEFFILKRLDGKKTLDDIRHEFVTEHRPQRLSIEELETYVRQLLHAGVASVDSQRVGHRLFERHNQRKREKIKQTLASFMYLKIPLFDPERMLERMLSWCGFVFTLPFFIFACCFWLSALMLISANWTEFLAKLPKFEEFFHLKNVFLLWLTIGVVKVLHEFGHGISCKKFGGEVHEMGFMLLVFSPALYCNVTDAWMLPNRWHRVIIGAAGIYVELCIAAIAAWVWWFSEPGTLNFLCLSMITVCSVSTIVFNGNPLMKFDGYYIVSDLLEIPNLRERSNKYLGSLASRAAFGVEAITDVYAPTHHRWAFAAYAIAAYCYRWIVTIGILYFFYTFLKPHKLEIIGEMLACAAIFSMAVMPIWKIQHTLRRRWREMKVKTGRMVVGLSAITAILVAVLSIPLPLRVDLPMVLQARNATTVFIQAPGQLKELRVKDGDRISPGMVLAVLENLDYAREVKKLELEAATLLKRIEASASIGDQGSKRAAEIQYQSTCDRVHQMEREQEKLIIRVPQGVEGYCLAPPRETDMGRWLEPGKPFCTIGRPEDLEAYAVVDGSETSLLRLGQHVWVKVAGHVGSIHTSAIEKISETLVDDLPIALSSKAGGAVATTERDPNAEKDRRTRIENPEKPMMRSYSVTAVLKNPDFRLAPGLRGIVRVDCGQASLYWKLKRYLQQTFYFKI